VVARLLEDLTDVAPTLRAATEEVGGHLAHHPARVFPEHPTGDREDVILGGMTRSFLAPIAGERVHGPRPYPIVRMAEVRHELGDGGLVEVVVQHAAAPHPHRGIGVTQPAPQGERRQGTGREQLAQRVLRPVLDRQVLDQVIVRLIRDLE
jgi:hypothetical protein